MCNISRIENFFLAYLSLISFSDNPQDIIAADNNMQARVINQQSQLTELFHSNWNTLLTHSHDDTLFLSAQWIQSWLDIQEHIELFVIVVQEGDQLLAIAPLYIDKMHFLKRIEFRTLRILGDTHSGAEYPAIIAKPDADNRIYQAIWALLIAHKSAWDCIWLPRCGPHSSSIRHFLNATAKHPIAFREREHEFSAFTLPSSYDDYLKDFSRNHRNKMRRVEKKFDAIEGISVETCSDINDIDRYLTALFHLHALRWQEAGEEGAFKRRPLMEHFYRHFCPQAFNNGWLKMFLITHHQTPVAIQVGYLYNNTYLQMQEGFSPAFEKGVGNYLRIKMIRQLIDEGITTYDFLGGFGEHKQRWQGERKLGFDGFIWHNNWKGKLLSAKTIWPTGRLFHLQK